MTGLHQLKRCPVFSDCPFTNNGYCTVYGYELSVLKTAKHYFCPEYNWRYKKDVKFNEYRIRKRMWYGYRGGMEKEDGIIASELARHI
jgi:hypothetical protein